MLISSSPSVKNLREGTPRLSFKAFNYSTSCQPSLESGDILAAEESNTQQAGLAKEHNEGGEEQLISKLRPVQIVDLHIKPKQVIFNGLPLKVVVDSCVQRWFKEHVKNAEKGEPDAQILVGQMICHGYGVPKDVHKGEEWIRRGRIRQTQSKVESSEKKRSEDENPYFM